MNLTVFGSTGRTGRHVLELAMARGHSVTAFTRSRVHRPRWQTASGWPLSCTATAATPKRHGKQSMAPMR